MIKYIRNIVILVGVVLLFQSTGIEAKVLRMDECNSVYYNGSYYIYEKNYHYDIFTGIKIKKSTDNKNFEYYEYLEDVFSRPVIINKTLYYLKDTYSYAGKKPWGLYLYSYDLINKKNKLISKISDSEYKRLGEVILKKGNSVYIQTYDEDGDTLIIYEVNVNSKKVEVICKNLYALSVQKDCKDTYKNYLLCQNRTTGTGGFELSVVNLKTKKIVSICKNTACLYVKGKHVYYVDKKGIWSEDASYIDGFKKAKVKRYKFGSKKSKVLKKIKVRKSTFFYKITKNKVYYREVYENGKGKNKKVKYK